MHMVSDDVRKPDRPAHVANTTTNLRMRRQSVYKLRPQTQASYKAAAQNVRVLLSSTLSVMSCCG
eukprot:1893286-Amphidinium_carterae.1